MMIGIDFDDVLAEFITPLLRYHNEQYGTGFSIEDVTKYELTKTLNVPRDEITRRVDAFFMTEQFRDLPLVDGAEEATRILTKDHDLVIITARPIKVRDETIALINKKLPDRFLDVYFTSDWHGNGADAGRKKYEICHEQGVKVMIVDCFQYAHDCSMNGTRSLLYDRPWNRENNLNDKMRRVKSWEEILKEF